MFDTTENKLSLSENEVQTDIPQLGKFLKLNMKNHSLSLRALSKSSGICAASISRIINGKQPAGLHHLQAFAKAFDMPVEKLLSASGLSDKKPISDNSEFLLHTIQDILYDFEIDSDSIVENIKSELKKYYKYAKTDEGKRLIISDFLKKIDEINGTGIIVEHLHFLYQVFNDISESAENKALAGSALLYFVLSADIIPDYSFPLGFLDDAIAVNLVFEQLTPKI